VPSHDAAEVSPGPGPGVRLALDWGEVRIGVAACDPAGTLAYPVGVVPAGPTAYARVAQLIEEYEPVELLVGLPRSLSGGEGPAAQRVRAAVAGLVADLAGRGMARPVRLVDERLSTVTAARRLRAGGRPAKSQRPHIDAAAAVVILEDALARHGTEERRQPGLGSADDRADEPAS
jgi:putative Holliday junction resolvase